MKTIAQKVVKPLGIPRLIIISFLAILYVSAFFLKLPVAGLVNSHLVRMGMNGVLVLAMVPGILSGIGPNFGIPIGIVCGIIGGLMSIELDLYGAKAFMTAILISIPLSAAAGYFYGVLLNKVKGSEMMVATYAGFSVVSLMCIGWLILPFTSNEMKWPIGTGLRTTISLGKRFDKVLNDSLAFHIGSITIPTMLFVFFFAACFLVWLYLNSKAGIAMKVVGENPKFAIASGISVDRYRIISTVLSTVLGAIGIIVYAQSYGFFQLYTAPLMMAFGAVAAILIGGASSTYATIFHVILGSFLFQGLLVVALPVANVLVPEGNLSEVMRVVVQYGIILYALTKAGGGK
ncbi:MAG: ABC transporter permease [Anaeromicrobium sp.]|jgi:simple sugar transport system permease protein|uniref:ABC transporter permease subunit n=1 Tax=Anaeromicrobium sp. TaxID=1929132 RepID=UPI0025E8C98E|nr:ABC transporter permease [Anaeromicrobium sp.]MCT4593080.1 ABC transporter permease [Anaeromicrobium sp.]